MYLSWIVYTSHCVVLRRTIRKCACAVHACGTKYFGHVFHCFRCQYMHYIALINHPAIVMTDARMFAATVHDDDQTRKSHKPRVAPHNDSSQVLNCIHPVRGIRDLMMRYACLYPVGCEPSDASAPTPPTHRQGIRPPNHMAHNRKAISRKSDENKQRRQAPAPQTQPRKPQPAPRCVFVVQMMCMPDVARIHTHMQATG